MFEHCYTVAHRSLASTPSEGSVGLGEKGNIKGACKFLLGKRACKLTNLHY